MRKELHDTFDRIIERNVSLVRELEVASMRTQSATERFSQLITHFCGTPAFFWINLSIFVPWMLWNGMPTMPAQFRFDPPPFSFLSLGITLEAIILSIFILMTQNRQQS